MSYGRYEGIAKNKLKRTQDRRFNPEFGTGVIYPKHAVRIHFDRGHWSHAAPFKLALISVLYRSSKSQLGSAGVNPVKVVRGGRTSCGEIRIMDPQNRRSSFQWAMNTKGHSIRVLETNDGKKPLLFFPLGSWCHKCSQFFSRPTRTQTN